MLIYAVLVVGQVVCLGWALGEWLSADRTGTVGRQWALIAAMWIAVALSGSIQRVLS